MQQAAVPGYQKSGQGDAVRIDSASVHPTTLRRGQRVKLGMNYTVAAPSGQTVPVTVVREVRFGNSVVGAPHQVSMTNGNGSFQDTVDYTLPKNAVRGSYTVINRVVSSYGASQQETSFIVE